MFKSCSDCLNLTFDTANPKVFYGKSDNHIVEIHMIHTGPSTEFLIAIISESIEKTLYQVTAQIDNCEQILRADVSQIGVLLDQETFIYKYYSANQESRGIRYKFSCITGQAIVAAKILLSSGS